MTKTLTLATAGLAALSLAFTVTLDQVRAPVAPTDSVRAGAGPFGGTFSTIAWTTRGPSVAELRGFEGLPAPVLNVLNRGEAAAAVVHNYSPSGAPAVQVDQVGPGPAVTIKQASNPRRFPEGGPNGVSDAPYLSMTRAADPSTGLPPTTRTTFDRNGNLRFDDDGQATRRIYAARGLRIGAQIIHLDAIATLPRLPAGAPPVQDGLAIVDGALSIGDGQRWRRLKTE